MGPAGCLVFVAVVMLSEMIPLFPTQPLSLASGLLFGGKQVWWLHWRDLEIGMSGAASGERVS